MNTHPRSIVLAALTLAIASGCVTTSDAPPPGSDWATIGLTSIAAYGALPETAEGRGPVIDPRLTSGVFGPGAIIDIDATTVIELALAQGSPFDGGGRIVPPSADQIFSARTIAQLQGRLTVRRVDETGALADGTFQISRGSLVRDGALVTALRPGGTLTFRRLESDDEGGTSIQTVTAEGNQITEEVERLLRLCLLHPAAPLDWPALRGSGDPPIGGTVRALDAAGLGLMLGEAITVPVAAGPVGEDVPAATGTLQIAGDGRTLEARLVASQARDLRIAGMFGDNVSGPGKAAVVHRRSLSEAPGLPTGASGSPTGPPDPLVRTETFISSRFTLRDEDGPIEGERLERLDLRLTIRRPAGGGG